MVFFWCIGIFSNIWNMVVCDEMSSLPLWLGVLQCVAGMLTVCCRVLQVCCRWVASHTMSCLVPDPRTDVMTMSWPSRWFGVLQVCCRALQVCCKCVAVSQCRVLYQILAPISWRRHHHHVDLVFCSAFQSVEVCCRVLPVCCRVLLMSCSVLQSREDMFSLRSSL